jgi:hypothetical protein
MVTKCIYNRSLTRSSLRGAFLIELGSRRNEETTSLMVSIVFLEKRNKSVKNVKNTFLFLFVDIETRHCVSFWLI